MSAIRSATVLALWGAARIRGAVSPDAVLTALAGTGATAGVRAVDAQTARNHALPGPGEPGAGTVALLELLRRATGIRLVLPVAGDVRGLPAQHPALVTALDLGAAVVVEGPDVVVIPVDGHWRVFGDAAGGLSAAAETVLDAEREIDRAIVAATARLRELDIARDSHTVRDELAAAMRRAALDTPPTMPRPAGALLAKVISLEALLAAATGHRTNAVSRYELAAVDDTLRGLADVVRRGRLAAVAAGTGIDPSAGADHRVPVPARHSTGRPPQSR